LAMRAATPARPSGWARYPTASCRDRSHFADPIVRHGANQGCIIATAISR
jgi:hypothetical protein